MTKMIVFISLAAFALIAALSLGAGATSKAADPQVGLHISILGYQIVQPNKAEVQEYTLLCMNGLEFFVASRFDGNFSPRNPAAMVQVMETHGRPRQCK